MSAEDKLRDELLAVMWRYSMESNVTLMGAIKAAHRASERLVELALDAKEGEQG
jgi:hypothetical protein